MNEKKGQNKQKVNFCHVPLDIVSKYGHKIPFDLFLKISDTKMVKVGHQDDDVKATVVKYVNKGVKEIFAQKKDYLLFLDLLNRELAEQFFDPALNPVERMNLLTDVHQVLKECFTKIGICEEAINLTKKLAKKTTEFVDDIKNVKTVFEKFKDKCNHEYIRGVFIGSTAVSMIDTFEWQSDAIKEKIVQSILLRDILLNAQDLVECARYKDNPKKLSDKVFNHPVETVKLLNGDNGRHFSQEVLNVIEQHHERPKGKGYPAGIDHKRIILLSAVQIVADEFIERMVGEKFDIDRRMIVLNEMEGEFSAGNYRIAFESLDFTLGK